MDNIKLSYLNNLPIFSDEKKSDKKVLILFGENKYDWEQNLYEEGLRFSYLKQELFLKKNTQIKPKDIDCSSLMLFSY